MELIRELPVDENMMLNSKGVKLRKKRTCDVSHLVCPLGGLAAMETVTSGLRDAF